MSSPPRSLCVIRLSAIGDCCHALPVVQAIRSAWPETRITWIIGQTEHALLEGLAGVDFLVLDKRAGHRGMRELKEKLKARRFDLLLQMQDSLRASRVALMAGCGRRRVGFDRRRGARFAVAFHHRADRPSASATRDGSAVRVCRTRRG